MYLREPNNPLPTNIETPLNLMASTRRDLITLGCEIDGKFVSIPDNTVLDTLVLKLEIDFM